MKEKLKRYLPQIIVCSAALLAFIFSLFLAGAKMKQVESGIVVDMDVKLIGLMFGNSKINAFATYLGTKVNLSISYEGATSVFGIISFVCIILGIVFTVLSIFFNGKKFDLIGAILVALAGICIFLVLVAGGDAVSDSSVWGGTKVVETFKEFYDGTHISAGVYVYGILCVFGGAYGICSYFKNRTM